MKAFMYHYMRERSDSLPRVHCIKPSEFKMHVKITNPMSKEKIEYSLENIKKKMENQERKMDVDQGVIITFDDGIKDNIEAAEILEAEGSSGIFFLASMPYTHGRFLDVHMIHLIVYQDNMDIVYEKFLELIAKKPHIEELFYKFQAKTGAEFNFYGDEERSSNIKVFMNRYFPLDTKSDFLRELMDNLDIKERVEDFYLTKSEIKQLEKMGMIIGGHSHSHNLLSRLSKEKQLYEIMKCKKTIEGLMEEELKIFSYPYGRKSSYDKNTLEIVKQNNFKYAFSVEDIDIENSKNEYELGRYNCNSLESTFFDK